MINVLLKLVQEQFKGHVFKCKNVFTGTFGEAST